MSDDYSTGYIDGVNAALATLDIRIRDYFGSLFEPNSNAGIALTTILERTRETHIDRIQS